MGKFTVSVIMPAYNEEEYIGHCLKSLTEQKTKYSFEVVVIDNNSTDKTNKIAQSFKDKLNIRVIVEKRQGRGIARWRGFEEATGKFLFSTDADTTFPPNWIDGMMKYFEDEDVVAVTSLCTLDHVSKSNRTLFDVVHLFTTESYKVMLGDYCLYGFSYAVRKNAYVRAGKIDYKLNALDDIDLGVRLKRIGKIKLAKNIKVITSNRRYKNGMVRGLLEYVKPLMQLSINKDKLVMDNSR